jgi:hypothetical protein
VANGATGILTSEPTPAVARRTWPQWLALGIGMLAVAVTAVLWDAAGARLLLGSIGAFLAARGFVLLTVARGLGTVATVTGLACLGVAVISGSLAAGVLMVGVPLLLVAAAVALLARGGVARRGGQAALVWAVLIAGLLVVTGAVQGWERAEDVAAVVTALVVAVLAVPVLVGAAHLRTVGARPDPEEGRPLGCAGCACAGGGCAA